MDLYILNTQFEPVAIVDSFNSLLWVTRYFEPGDFELYVAADNALLQYLKYDYYVMREDSDVVMVIEKIEIKTDAENGDYFIVTGRSLESILDRRIIWTQTNINAPACAATFNLITQNAISASDVKRNINNLSIDASGTALITSKVNQQFTGNNLLTTIVDIAKQFGFGWRIKLNDKQFVYQCYARGEVDVTFSPEFDNLINSNYMCDYAGYKNCGLIAGEGEGTARKTTSIYVGNAQPEGLARRETFIDARDISSNNGTITDAEYYPKLAERGYEKIKDNVISQTFDGDIEPTMTYTYKRDYDVGNIVTIENEYGIVAKPRIIEIIESWDESGYSVVPTFEEWEV